ncbi:MAG: ATP-binding protein [Lachnospiraceae bacterium]|nr:ATP-binding protein [Lachnospiraceae bacterium]
MKLQRLMNLVRKAMDEYGLIEEGDRIAIGISGGKDSLALLYALSGIQRYYPKHFELQAITVSLGFENFRLEPIKALCADLQVPYTVVETEIGPIIFDERNESNPCSLCAKMRKGALNTRAKELGCNKIAYAHHKDDVVETMLLSLIYEGRFYSFSPKTYLDRMDLTVIRPMIFVEEADVIGFRNKYQLPVAKNPCPADGHTKREYAGQLLRQITRENPGAKERMFTAVLSGNIQGWPQRNPARRGSHSDPSVSSLKSLK